MVIRRLSSICLEANVFILSARALTQTFKIVGLAAGRSLISDNFSELVSGWLTSALKLVEHTELSSASTGIAGHRPELIFHLQKDQSWAGRNVNGEQMAVPANQEGNVLKPSMRYWAD